MRKSIRKMVPSTLTKTCCLYVSLAATLNWGRIRTSRNGNMLDGSRGSQWSIEALISFTVLKAKKPKLPFTLATAKARDLFRQLAIKSLGALTHCESTARCLPYLRGQVPNCKTWRLAYTNWLQPFARIRAYTNTNSLKAVASTTICGG